MTSRKSLAHNRLPKDQILYCDRCGISFLWSGEEQQMAARPVARERQEHSDDQSNTEIHPSAPLRTGSEDTEMGAEHLLRKHRDFLESQTSSAETQFVPDDHTADSDDEVTGDIDAIFSSKPTGKMGTVKIPTRCAGCRALMPDEGRERGVVKWYNSRKRFGFITREDGTEIFAHGSRIKNAKRLQEDSLVEFRPTEGNQGPAAADIRVLDALTADSSEAGEADPKPESIEESVRQVLAKGKQTRGQPAKAQQSKGQQSKGKQPKPKQSKGKQIKDRQSKGEQTEGKQSKGKQDKSKQSKPKQTKDKQDAKKVNRNQR